MVLKTLSLFFLFLLTTALLMAQNDTIKLKYDSSYYERYPHKLIVTPFVVKNFQAVTLSSPDADDAVKYYANAPAGIGLRVGYDWLAIGASYGTGFIDPDYNKAKGKTKALNLQTTFAAKSLLIDIYYQKYKGMYLRADDVPSYTSEPYYVRPKIDSRMLGVTASYVFNGRKFSIRPPFKYDTWQKKSAGSLLAGVEYLMGSIKGDSALIPLFYASSFPQKNIQEMKYMLFGPNIGYGYTWVIDKNFYLSGLATLNADVGFTKEYVTSQSAIQTNDDKHWSFSPNFSFRGGMGYTNERWQLAFSYFTKRVYLNGKSEGSLYRGHNDDFRLSYTRRINAGKRIPKTINWAGNIIEKLGLGFLIR